MFSLPTDAQVAAELGDKFLMCFVDAVDAARDDYTTFRQWRPGWFASFTNRFTSNFVHERVWAHMIDGLDDDAEVAILDKEPRRELTVGGRYVMRIKRHSETERIRSYPTSTALDFWTQKPALDGLEKITLAIGYIWDPEERAVKAPVLSLRDGLDEPPVWAIRFQGRGGKANPIAWEPIEPTDPTLDLSTILKPQDDVEESDS